MSANFIPRQLPQLTDSAGTPLPNITSAEMGYLAGVMSAIQTQLNGKYGAGAAIVGASFTIGANTLDVEWAYLKGLNQPLTTTSSPTFANITVSGSIKAGGYKSADGSPGVSGTFTTGNFQVFVKNGLITGIASI